MGKMTAENKHIGFGWDIRESYPLYINNEELYRTKK